MPSNPTTASGVLPPTPKLVTVIAPNGAKFAVAQEYAPQFQGLVNDLTAGGVVIDPNTSGGYNRRFIAGTNIPSKHAFGQAVDVDSSANPQGGSGGAMDPALAHQVASKYGLTWGGDWTGKTRDPMHFEVADASGGGAAKSLSTVVAPQDNTAPPAAAPVVAQAATPAPTTTAQPSGPPPPMTMPTYNGTNSLGQALLLAAAKMQQGQGQGQPTQYLQNPTQNTGVG